MVGQIKHVFTNAVADDPALTNEVRPSDWNSAHKYSLTIAGNTQGQSTLSGTNIVLSGGNNVTLSADPSGSIGIIGPNTVAQTNQTEGFYAVGNTTENSSTTLDARTVSIGGRGIVTVGYSNGSIDISATVAAQTNQTIGLYAAGNTTGQSSSTTDDARTVSVDGAGIVSVGYSAGSLVVSATTPAQTNQTDGIYLSQNTTGNSSSLTHDARSLTIEGLGGVSVGWSTNNSHLLISGPQTVAQTNQSLGLYASSQTYDTSSTTVDARSISIVGQGGISVGMSNGSLMLSGITDAAQTAQTMGLYAVGNTTGQSSSTTVDARTVSFDATGSISIGFSGGSIVVSQSGGGAADGYNIIEISGNTAGTTTSFSAATIALDAGSNITLSQSSNTITFNAPAERSYWSNGIPDLGTNLVSSLGPAMVQQSNTIASFAPFHIEYPVAFSQVVLPVWFSIATAGNTSSRGVMFSMTAAVYSRSASSITSYITTSGTQSSFIQSNSDSLMGNRLLSLTIAQTTLSPGDYWFGLYVSTATSGQVSAANTLLVRPIDYLLEQVEENTSSLVRPYGTGGTDVNAVQNPIFLPFGSGAGSSYGFQWNLGRGTITHAGSVGSKALTAISVSGSAYPYIEPCFILRNWKVF